MTKTGQRRLKRSEIKMTGGHAEAAKQDAYYLGQEAASRLRPCTPPYPKRGNRHPVGVRADLFRLGYNQVMGDSPL